MAPRKPLDEGCDGGVFCPVKNHVRATRFNMQTGETTWAHIPLTAGQRKTLMERRREARRAR